MESGPSQFLSSELLRQIISLANHPMHVSFKSMMEQMVQAINVPTQNNPYQQMQDVMTHWQGLFKTPK